MLGLLVRQRLRLGWNRLARGRGRGRRGLGTLVLFTFSASFLVLAGFNTGALGERVARVDPVAARAMLATLLVAVTVLTLVTGLGSGFHHLFLAPDLELLLAAPVPPRSLLWLKVLETWRDAVHVLLFQGVALIGYGQALRLPAPYYALALAVGLLLTLGASALAACITLLLARVRFGESVLGLSRIASILLFIPVGLLGVPLLGRGRATSVFGQANNAQAIVASLREIGPPPEWLPTTWAMHLLLGDERALPALLGLCGLGVGVVATSELAFRCLFGAAWERVRFAGSRPTSPARARASAAAVNGPLLSLLRKDWRTLVRDPRWRTSATISLVALGLPALALVTGDPFGRAAPAVRFWLGLLPVPYLAYLFGSQQGAATLAYEGHNIALLRAAPVGVGQVLLAKVLGGLGLVLGVTWVLTLVLSIDGRGSPLEVGLAMLAATWLSVGATTAAVAGTALTADFESDNPQRRVGCLGMIVTSALSVFFSGSNTLLLGWALARALGVVPGVLLGVAPILDFGLAALAVASAATVGLAAHLGVRRLAHWEAS